MKGFEQEAAERAEQGGGICAMGVASARGVAMDDKSPKVVPYLSKSDVGTNWRRGLVPLVILAVAVVVSGCSQMWYVIDGLLFPPYYHRGVVEFIMGWSAIVLLILYPLMIPFVLVAVIWWIVIFCRKPRFQLRADALTWALVALAVYLVLGVLVLQNASHGGRLDLH